MNLHNSISIVKRCISDYHQQDVVDAASGNPYPPGSIENLLYEKSWTDNIQWHLEDIIRDPAINPAKALELKRKIDKYNQQRTELVELMDDWFMDQYKEIKPQPGATWNTETPAWAFDRLSILELKIWHMEAEAERPDAPGEHREKAKQKWKVLKKQEEDLSSAIQQLMDDLAAGRKVMKVYRQMKMYNDESLNPVLYQQKNKS